MSKTAGRSSRGLEAWLDRLGEAIAARLIQRGSFIIAFGLIATAFLLYRATLIGFQPGFDKSLPTSHPSTQTYHKYAGAFGSANRIIVALHTRNDEDILTERPLRVVEHVAQTLTTLPGLEPSSLRALFSPTALYISVTSEGFEGGRIVPEEFRYRQEDIARVRANLLRSGELGRLISEDFRAALLTVEVIDDTPATYVGVRNGLDALRADAEAKGMDVHIIGFVPFISQVQEGAKAVYIFFAVSVVFIFVLLLLFTRSTTLSAVTLLVAACAVVWQLGLFELLGFSLDPLSVLVPFLVLSIGVSHAVQMVNAWMLSVTQGSSPTDSAVLAFNRVFVPGTTALLANAVGFAVIMVINIPIIHELGIAASLGVMTMIITNKIILPAVLAKIPSAGIRARGAPQMRRAAWGRRLAWTTSRKGVVAIAVIVLAAWAFAERFRSDLIVGDVDFGVPELRADSQYNRDAAAVGRDFHIGLDELTVVAEGRERGCTWFPMIYAIDRFQREIGSLDPVVSHDSLASQMRMRAVANAQGHWAFDELPSEERALGAAMRGMEIGQGYFNGGCSAVPIRFFLENHKAETLRTVTEAIAAHAAQLDPEVVTIKSALGSAGLMAATNEEVQRAQSTMLLVLYAAVALLVWLTFLSLRAVVCIVIPLIVVSQVAEAIMVLLGIGLKVSTLPVVALGVGVGVDYGIYFFARFRAHFDSGTRLPEAFQQAFNDVGPAIAFTGIAMSAGVLLWIWSPLKLQADMGLLLAYMFIVNMVGALVVLPALARLLFRDRPLARMPGAREPMQLENVN